MTKILDQLKDAIDHITWPVVIIGVLVGHVIYLYLLRPAPAGTVTGCDARAVAEQVLRNERPQMGELERRFHLDILQQHFVPHGISVALAASLGAQESKFRTHLVSSAGARGTFQVMPNIWLGTPECPRDTDLFEEEANAECSARILAKYIQEGGNVEAGLRRYQAGPYGQDRATWYANEVMTRLARATQQACPAASALYLTSADKP
jgi:hypothetical protein